MWKTRPFHWFDPISNHLRTFVTKIANVVNYVFFNFYWQISSLTYTTVYIPRVQFHYDDNVICVRQYFGHYYWIYITSYTNYGTQYHLNIDCFNWKTKLQPASNSFTKTIAQEMAESGSAPLLSCHSINYKDPVHLAFQRLFRFLKQYVFCRWVSLRGYESSDISQFSECVHCLKNNCGWPQSWGGNIGRQCENSTSHYFQQYQQQCSLFMNTLNKNQRIGSMERHLW